MHHLAHTILGNGANGRCRNLQGNPLPTLRDVEFLQLQIGIEATLGLHIGMGNMVSLNGAFTGQIANFGHNRRLKRIIQPDGRLG